MAEPIDKKTLLLRFLDRGMAMVHVDSRQDGVQVPKHLADDGHVALNLSWRFPDAGMVVDDAGVRATLHFAGTPFTTILPWRAVFAVYSHATGEGFAWPEHVPADVAQSMLEKTAERKKPRLSAVRPTPMMELSVVPPEEAQVPEVVPPSVPQASRAHLRLIK